MDFTPLACALPDGATLAAVLPAGVAAVLAAGALAVAADPPHPATATIPATSTVSLTDFRMNMSLLQVIMPVVVTYRVLGR